MTDAAPGAAAGAAAAPPAPPPPQWRLYYNTNGFAHHRLEDALELLAELGYDGVALTPDVHHLHPFEAGDADVDAVRARIERLGLGVTIEGGARFVLDARRKHRPSLLSHEGHERRAAFNRRLVDLAERLGAPLVSIWSGSDDAPRASDEHALARLAERLLPLLEHAAARGVTVAFEPEPGMRVETLAQFEALRARLLPQRLALTVDVGHLAASESRPWPEHLVEHRHALAYVQLDDAPAGRHEHLAFGEGELDFPALAAALARADYRGVCAVELSRHSHVAPQAAKEALRFLRASGF